MGVAGARLLMVFTVGIVLILTCCGCFMADLSGIISSDEEEDDLENSSTWIRRIGVLGLTDTSVAYRRATAYRILSLYSTSTICLTISITINVTSNYACTIKNSRDNSRLILTVWTGLYL